MSITEIHEIVAAAGGAAGILLLALVAAAPWLAGRSRGGQGASSPP